MSNALVAMTDMTAMAQAFAKSGLFGNKTPDQCLALMLLANAEGVHPAIAMRDFDVIQGRPAKKAEAMLRSFIAGGGSVEWHDLSDTKADATFSHPQGGKARISWDLDRAKKAGIADKDNWKKYARAMLRSRVVSEGCRTVYPAATSGLYEPGEVRDMGKQEKDMGAAVVVEPDHNYDEAYVKQSAADLTELTGMVDRAPDMDTLKKVGKEIAKRVGTMIPNDIAQLRGAYSGKEKVLRQAEPA